MDSDDEFNQFVMDEIIDSSSSDDERKAAILGAAHMIVEDTINHPRRLVFVPTISIVIVTFNRLLYKWS